MAELWKSLSPETLAKLIQYQHETYGDKLEFFAQATSPIMINTVGEVGSIDQISRFMKEKPNTDDKDE